MDSFVLAIKLNYSRKSVFWHAVMSELVRLSLDRAGEEKEKIMDFALTDEQELLVESLKEYADRYFDDESVGMPPTSSGRPMKGKPASRYASWASALT